MNIYLFHDPGYMPPPKSLTVPILMHKLVINSHCITDISVCIETCDITCNNKFYISGDKMIRTCK